ncbi:GNAT family N-acetyltransferase [Rufibacter glacialis]|uniref:GNAT family N-acetyltransferase n=1 Tax=Rufibacter glacialis TaxID=1259555 RepID=A0A5M8Q8U1_9BACT|nr:GNAT family N-acetyltransferase [Rufibacter glacialis]KAA6432375.1 GNAT family N-acetyltransferase [Rufibacter glacialis]GGK78171.1 hypothetical protein GCM10011405_27470 [Rufibacter glacialis]
MMELKLENFTMRLVEEEDSEFIVQLRDNKYLSGTSPDVEEQKAWVRSYKEREAERREYYFIAEDLKGKRLGLARIYNFKGESFELGSWVFMKGIDESIPVLVDIAVRDFAYDRLGFRVCRFTVSKENKAVLRYHRMYKPELVREDEENYYFELELSAYKNSKRKILNIIENGS